MTLRITPSQCARCGRPSNEWAVEREPGRNDGGAGCPCGEVMRVAFADDELAGSPVSETPRRPGGWSEDGRADAWSATLKPNPTERYWRDVAPAFLIGPIVYRLAEHKLLTLLIVAVVACLVKGLGTLVETRKRTLSFAFETGRFRADVEGKHDDVALEDILRFSVATASRAAYAWRRPPFELAVHCSRGQTLRIPLFVEDVHEAQFVADRANELLSTGGRAVDHGYRGERPRIALEKFGDSRWQTGRPDIDEPDIDERDIDERTAFTVAERVRRWRLAVETPS